MPLGNFEDQQQLKMQLRDINYAFVLLSRFSFFFFLLGGGECAGSEVSDSTGLVAESEITVGKKQTCKCCCRRLSAGKNVCVVEYEFNGIKTLRGT